MSTCKRFIYSNESNFNLRALNTNCAQKDQQNARKVYRKERKNKIIFCYAYKNK